MYIYTGALIGDGGNPEATLGNRIRAAIAIDIEATRMAAQFSLAHGHFRHHVLVLDRRSLADSCGNRTADDAASNDFTGEGAVVAVLASEELGFSGVVA